MQLDRIYNEYDFQEYLRFNNSLRKLFKSYNINKIHWEYKFKSMYNQMRIDCMIECDNCIILCELKYQLMSRDIGQLMQYRLLCNEENNFNKPIYCFLLTYTEKDSQSTLLTIDMINQYNLNCFGFIIWESDKYFYYNNQITKNINLITKLDNIAKPDNNKSNTYIIKSMYRR